MNIFFLHLSVRRCARWHCDRHCVKMILEYAQLLCSAIWLSGGTAPYKLTHKNHPCAIWARHSQGNWLWLKSLALALCDEYTFRYGKVHRTQEIIEQLEVPDLPNEWFTQPPQAMPVEYKDTDSITAYRNYYILGKKHLHSWKDGRHAWKKRKIPSFIPV
jgi:hypothetical protein